MTDELILAFLLDKKRNEAKKLQFLLKEVTDQLRIAYPSCRLELGKAG